MPRRIVKAVRSVKKFYGLGRYNIPKKKRGLRSARAATKATDRAGETDRTMRARGKISFSEFQRRSVKRAKRAAKSNIATEQKMKQLYKAHRTRRRATAGSGLVIVGTGGVTYRSRSKRKRQS